MRFELLELIMSRHRNNLLLNQFELTISTTSITCRQLPVSFIRSNKSKASVTAMAPGKSLEEPKLQWKNMFQKSLPRAASSKLPTQQKKWPVTLNHCSARKILDNVVGIDSAWTKKIGSPAYKNTSREQLQASIDLGDAILRGDAHLVGLDSKSLTLRGKPSKNGNKAKLETGEHRS